MNIVDNEAENRPEEGRALSSAGSGDLPDSPRDEERMRPEEVILDLPDVKDIPGQEHIHVPSLGELADTTISSDDEEGTGLFGDDEEDEETEMISGNEADVTGEEKSFLQAAAEDMPATDDTALRNAELDNVDTEGDPLNEGGPATNVSGADLDTAGSDADDASEAIGEEDEENNTYSLGGDDKESLDETEP